MSFRAILLAGLLAASPGWSAEPPTAQAVSEAAQTLQSQGRSTEAVRMLDEHRGQCGEGPEGQGCRQILDYTKGYVLQETGPGSADPVADLREAAAAYEKVLADSPAHGPTLDNLVTIYQRLGEPEGAIPALERALRSGNATAEMAMQLGDLFLQDQRAEEARNFYRAALEKSPGDEAACRRIVLSYQASPGDSGAAELLRLGEGWEETVPGAARDAYEAAMGIAYAADPSLVETALVRWAGLLGRSNGVSTSDLDRLPADWSSPAVTGLRHWLEKPEAPPESWWRWNPRRSSALAGTSLALGRERLARGEPAKAEAVWVAGRELADSSTGIYTDLQTELALLYFRHPELDPGGGKFLDTENRLFNENLTARARHDLASNQRLHATLGLLYAERGTWESAIPGRGALFQLEAALTDAAQRDRDERTFQPLPWLRERLADGYRALSRKKKAATVYLEAARAYLDVDDLGKAAKMVEAGRALAQPSWDAVAEAGRIAAILDTRRRLAEAAERPDGKMSKRALESLAGSAWLAPSWSHSDPKFLDRQRFKALADLAAVEERSAEPAPALSHGSQAFGMALERRIYLSGAGDLLRLQRLQALVAAALGVSPPPPEPQVVAQTDAGDTLPLALPSGGAPARVRVSADTARLMRIIEDEPPE